MCRRQHVRPRHARGCRPAGVEDHITCKRRPSEAGRSLVWPCGDRPTGPHREGEEPKPMMHGQEKSDPAIVAKKPLNEAGQLVEEAAEPRAGTEGNVVLTDTRRALNRESVPHGLDRVGQSAKGGFPLLTQGGSRMRESRPSGSVRGASSNGRPYRDRLVFASGPLASCHPAKNPQRPTSCCRWSGYRAPTTLILATAPAMSARSAGVRSIAAALMFSSRRCSLVVPGIGTIHGC